MNFLLETTSLPQYAFWVPLIVFLALGVVSLIMYIELYNQGKSSTRGLFEFLYCAVLVFFPFLSIFLEAAYGILWASIVFLILVTIVSFALLYHLIREEGIKIIIWAVLEAVLVLTIIIPLHIGA